MRPGFARLASQSSGCWANLPLSVLLCLIMACFVVGCFLPGFVAVFFFFEGCLLHRAFFLEHQGEELVFCPCAHFALLHVLCNFLEGSAIPQRRGSLFPILFSLCTHFRIYSMHLKGGNDDAFWFLIVSCIFSLLSSNNCSVTGFPLLWAACFLDWPSHSCQCVRRAYFCRAFFEGRICLNCPIP
eukprot:RCo017261